MTQRHFDVIVLGGGGDALVAAILLARAGRRVQLIMREEGAGGFARPFEIAPGISVSLNLEADWVPDAVTKALKLDVAYDQQPIPASVALPDGGVLPLSRHVGDAATAIREHSPRDAQRWPAFIRTMHELSSFLETLDVAPAPDVEAASIGELPSLLSLGRSFRSLGKANMSELLRVLPMSIQDLADEWFTFEPLKAAIGAAAVRDIRQGPRSGGTSFNLLHYLTGSDAGALRGRPWSTIYGERGGLAPALEAEARRAGIEILTGAEVERITVREDAATGVVLRSGEEIRSRTVLSTLDPVKTFLGLVDPVWLDPEFLLAVRNIKMRGSTTFVFYRLDELPCEPGSGMARALTGIVSLSSSLDSIERAYDAVKYGSVAAQPHVEITMPSIRSSGAAGPHVLVAKVHYTPYVSPSGQVLADSARALSSAAQAAITRLMPGFDSRVRASVLLPPLALENAHGLTGGALAHGEMTLDQILFMRPVAGWSRYATPVSGLYLGGPGTHPGPGVFGASGLMAARRIISDTKKTSA